MVLEMPWMIPPKAWPTWYRKEVLALGEFLARFLVMALLDGDFLLGGEALKPRSSFLLERGADFGLDPLLEKSLFGDDGVTDLALLSIKAFMAGVSDDGVRLRHLKLEMLLTKKPCKKS